MKQKYFTTFLFFTLAFFFASILSLPVEAASRQELDEVGVLRVTDFGADPSGRSDSTSAIQQAMNASYNQQKALLFPSGTYLVRNTLEGELVSAQGYWRTKAYELIGSTDGPRPVIKLVNGAPGFQNTGSPKPVIRIHTVRNGSENPANGYTSSIRNLEIQVGSNNAGAVAIHFSGAQDNAIENVKIDMQSGYAGLRDLIGDNSVLNGIEIIGGRYGIYAPETRWPSMSDVTLTNQTAYAIYGVRGLGPLTISGFQITKQSAPVIKTDSGNWSISYGSGHITLVDGVIKLANPGSKPAIENSLGSDPDGRSVFLSNVYLNNVPNLIKSGNNAVVRPGNGWKRVDTYAYPFRQEKGETNIGLNLINGSINRSEIAEIESATQPPDMRAWHSIDYTNYPSPDVILDRIKSGDNSIVNVLDHSIRPASTAANTAGETGPDVTSALQNLINSHETVFLPKGKFLISSTLTLRENTKLIGLANHLTEIRTHDTWRPKSATDVIRTVNDATTDIKLAHMTIGWTTDPDRDWFTAIHWRAGGNSEVQNVMFRPRWSGTVGGNPKSEFRFTGNAGGRWFGAGFSANGNRTHHSGFRRMTVENINGPLIFYGLNLEDTHSTWQAEMKNSKNIAIHGFKNEDSDPMRVYNCDNVAIFGYGINPGKFLVESTTNNFRIYAGNIVHKRTHSTAGLVEKVPAKTTTISVDNIVSLYKRGEVDRSVFFSGIPQNTQPPETPTDIPNQDTDLDGDGDTDFLDFTILLTNIGDVENEPWDLEGNGTIDIFDYNVFVREY